MIAVELTETEEDLSMMKENHDGARQARNAKREQEENREKEKKRLGSKSRETATSLTAATSHSASVKKESACDEEGVETDDGESESLSGDGVEAGRKKEKEITERER